MKNFYPVKLSFLLVLMLMSGLSFAQNQINGTITDASTKEPLIGVSVQVKNKIIGTVTDTKGNFNLNTSTPVPFSLVISYVGYQTQEVAITASSSNINVSLEESSILGQEVVVAASRVEESVLKAPVAVEKMDIRSIQQNPSASFYEGLQNLKGIDMATQGLLFKSVNMRGFGGTGNVRTVQLMDGIDNQAPGLNFPVDNIVGMPELDLESVEIIPGAASALYGPNALNGLILMKSKSPFLYQGLSANVKTGVMSASNRDKVTTPFYDLSVRYAKAFNDKIAFKMNLAYITADDWQATNYNNLNAENASGAALGRSTTNYDGLNIYGDEVQTNMQTVANGLVSAGLLPEAAKALIPNTAVSRTGYQERDLVDYNTKSFKTNFAVHYRLNEKIEAIGQFNYGFGTTVYTGTGRYSLRNFNLSQTKLELRGDNFAVRGYTTQENSGQSYLAGLAAIGILNDSKPHATWFGQYVGAFAAAKLQNQGDDAAHAAARAVADAGVAQPGSAQFNTLLDKYRNQSIATGGGQFLDQTNLYHLDGFYDFKNQIDFLDLQVGANFRQYVLQSAGTLFADTKDGRDGKIPVNEYGAFIQAGKSLFAEHLRITGSLRYDKNQNFDGVVTPKVTAVGTFGQQNVRLSYQQGYRFPTNQNQYIDLTTPNGTLIGGLPEFDARYNLSSGILRQNLATANIAATIAADPTIQQQAIAYGTAAITAQAQPIITQAVTQAVTQAATAQITEAVTQAVTQAVTEAATAQITAAVTQQVTAQVQAAVAAGAIPNDPAAIQAAIAQGVTANLQTTIDAQLPGILQAQVGPTVAQTLPGELQSRLPGILQGQVPGLVQSQLTLVVQQQLPGLLPSLVPAFALAKLPKYQYTPLRPEKIQSWEIGYKGLIAKKLFVDAYYYESTYSDFIGGTIIVVPTAAAAPGLPIESGIGVGNLNGYSRPANTDAKIKSRGWAVGANYSLPDGFNLGFNLANNELTNFTPTPEQQYAGFNTPRYRYNLSFGRSLGSGDKLGFNIAFRHQNAFTWESTFVIPTNSATNIFTNTIVPAINNLDAQVSLKLSPIKSILKVGGTNIGGKPYYQAYGSASVGSMYYVSLSFDQLLNK